ncbi:MAG: cyclopropane-fatty-acyl-phospholipid synthase [Mycobacterium sp.]|jgi:cyclopropane-fatty-acyl-phospholipid synthase|nr:cyclopropane-fatty-acyl-phospholipid synthase [Mycobacterium sp.]
MGIVSSIADRVAELFRTTIGIDPPVRIRAWDGSEAGPADGPVLVTRSRRALRRLLWRPGELGLARGYVTRDIDVEGDLADGLRRAWRLARAHPGAAISARGCATAALHALRLGALGPPPRVPASEARLSGPLHTRRRDRAVIAHHYDLSNEFYLDVGCGWGSLVLHAVERYGVRATGITLSAQQRDFVVARATERGLSNSIDVRLQDYRDFGDLPTSRDAFDAVASIEMGEHVGEQFYPSYAGILYRALKPGASVLLQQMSRRPDAAPGGGAFIEAYIAPDMHMRPLWQTLRHLQNADFEIRSVEEMRQHYARTAQHWIDTLEQRFAEFVALLGEEVARVWRLYLVGGMLAFEEGRMGVDQILATKPR